MSKASFLKGGDNRIIVNARKQFLLNSPVILPPAWFDNVNPATSNATLGSSLSSVQVIVGLSGTASKLRIKLGISNFDGQSFRFAVYSSDGSTFLSYTGTATINIADSNTLKEFDISPFTVTAGTTYMLAAYLNGNETDIFAATTADAHTSLYDHPSFLSFPQSSLTSPYFTTQLTIPCGIYVTP